MKLIFISSESSNWMSQGISALISRSISISKLYDVAVSKKVS